LASQAFECVPSNSTSPRLPFRNCFFGSSSRTRSTVIRLYSGFLAGWLFSPLPRNKEYSPLRRGQFSADFEHMQALSGRDRISRSSLWMGRAPLVSFFPASALNALSFLPDLPSVSFLYTSHGSSPRVPHRRLVSFVAAPFFFPCGASARARNRAQDARVSPRRHGTEMTLDLSPRYGLSPSSFLDEVELVDVSHESQNNVIPLFH